MEVDRASGLATIYHNGVDVTVDGTIRTDFNTSSDWEIGKMEAGDLWFKGVIDEFRIGNVDRSADWVEASYLSQNGAFTFNTYAAEESSATGVESTDMAAPVAAITRDDANPTTASTVVFSDSSGATGNDFQATFNIGGGAVSVADAIDATLTDNTTNLASLLVTVTDIQGGALEVLAADTSGTSIGAVWDSGTGVLTLSGADTVANYQQVLRTVTYNHTGANPINASHSITFVANDGTNSGNTATTSLSIVQSVRRLWLSTEGDVGSPSGAPDLDSWTDAEALEFSGIGQTFEPTVTSGSFSSMFNIDDFASAATDVQGLHIVGRDITVGGGANTFDLKAGDVIAAVADNVTLTSTDSQDVQKRDVFVYRPDAVDDYSSGTFWLLLDDPFNDNTSVSGISLVEQDTTVGGILLKEGEFLLSETGKAGDDIYLFTADAVGEGTTSGTESTRSTTRSRPWRSRATMPIRLTPIRSHSVSTSAKM